MQKHYYIDKNWRWPVQPKVQLGSTEQIHFLEFPSDVINTILQQLNLFDKLMLRTVCKSLYNAIASQLELPKHFVLDQEKCLEYYVTQGSISALEYLKSMNFFFTPSLCTLAADVGRLDVLKYLRESGCTLDMKTHMAAIRRGDLDILKYTLECVPKDKINRGPIGIDQLFSEAAATGHMHVVKYLHENGFEWSIYVSGETYRNDQFEIFKYAVENGCHFDPNKPYGILSFMKYAEERKLNWKNGACVESVKNGNLDALIYARENGCEWSNTAAVAARLGRMECLKYALENGAPFDECESVHSVEILEYLIQKKVPLTPNIYDHAVNQKNRDVIYYMLKHTTITTALNVIAHTGDLELFKLAHEKNFPAVETLLNGNREDKIDVYTEIVRSGSLDCLKYAIEKEIPKRYEKNNNNFIILFMDGINKRYDMIKWWLETFPYEFSNQDLLNIAKGGSVELVDLVIEKGAKFELNHLGKTMEYKNIEKIAYLLKRYWNQPWDINRVRVLLPCFKYAYEHGYSWPIEFLIKMLSDSYDESLLSYAKARGILDEENFKLVLASKRKSKLF